MNDFLIAGLLLAASIAANKFSHRLGIPALLMFLGLGMLAGEEGPGGIAFDSAETARTIGDYALAIILFTGGLDTSWRSIRPILGKGLALATVGVAVTTLIVGTFAWFVLGSFSTFDIGPRGLTWLQALLVAAIMSSTDAPAVFAQLRSGGVGLRGDLQPLLEFESGSNDPMAILLTTGILGMMGPDGDTLLGLVGLLARELVLGVVVGAALGAAAVTCLTRARLPAQGLYPLAAVSAALITVGCATMAGGNGLLAVYIAGLVIGNRLRPHRASILAFHDGLAWLAQIALFLMLGLLVNPSELLPLAGVATALSFFLILVARPLAVMVCLLPFRTPWRETTFVSWVGLRGSVPIVLATYPSAAGMAEADAIFNVVFFVVLISVIVQGLTLVPAARAVGVSAGRGPSARS
jgi:cell volume regulation protein A